MAMSATIRVETRPAFVAPRGASACGMRLALGGGDRAPRGPLGNDLTVGTHQITSAAGDEWVTITILPPSTSPRRLGVALLFMPRKTSMQDAVMQSAAQPFLKLVQSNMALLTQFSMSPEMISQVMSNIQSQFLPGQGSATKLAPSNAFGELMQGMMRNYAEFMTELGRGSMAMMAQGQAAMMEQAQDAVERVATSDAKGRRAR
jgi:hypothetical protein